MPNYTASKVGIDSITRSAVVILVSYGVLVNRLTPDMMDTHIQRSIEIEMARINGRSDLPAFLGEPTKRIPLGRRTDINEIVQAVIWLCLDAPSYMTAEHLNMSGGLDRG